MITKNIVIEDAHIIFRNFSGAEGQFNPAGRRNFCVLLSLELADELSRDGWNVKVLAPREEGDDPQPYLQVAVSYDNIPPKIVMITSRSKTLLDGETVGLLDAVDIEHVDLIIRPYNWTLATGKSGVKAYVKSMYVTVAEDEFEGKYADLPMN